MNTPASRTERRANWLTTATRDQHGERIGDDYVPLDAAGRAEAHRQTAGLLEIPIPLTYCTPPEK